MVAVVVVLVGGKPDRKAGCGSSDARLNDWGPAALARELPFGPDGEETAAAPEGEAA